MAKAKRFQHAVRFSAPWVAVLVFSCNPLFKTELPLSYHPGFLTGTPASISVSAPSTVSSTKCSSSITLTAKDASGATVVVENPVTISLGAGGSSAFYTDASCSSSAGSSVQIPSGSSSATVYFKSSSPGNRDLTFAATGVSAASVRLLVRGVTKVVTGSNHTCALFNDGTVSCWGMNRDRQLGDGTTTNRFSPVTVQGVSNAVDITSGASFVCVLLPDKTIQCWGYNSSGQLGVGSAAVQTSVVSPVGISSAVEIESGPNSSHVCARLADATIRCWGYNVYGQIGDGTTSNRTSPYDPGLTGVIGLSVGDGHTCALLSGGTVRCVGLNSGGQLGDGTTTNNTSWVTVSGVTTAEAIWGGGGSRNCVRLANQTYQCWGSNAYGSLGDGTGTSRSTPVAVSMGGVVSDFQGGTAVACILLTTGQVRCSGANREGVLGGFTLLTVSGFMDIPGFSGATSMGVGVQHLCASFQDGTVACQGSNVNGQLGNGIRSGKFEPTQVPGVNDAVSISAGNFHHCAVRSGGGITCAGWDQASQLGRGGANVNATPMSVSPGSPMARSWDPAGQFTNARVSRTARSNAGAITTGASSGTATRRPSILRWWSGASRLPPRLRWETPTPVRCCPTTPSNAGAAMEADSWGPATPPVTAHPRRSPG